MTYGKWTDNGELSWKTADILYAADLNTTLQTCIPIGGIVAWAGSGLGGKYMFLPGNWVECNGSAISDASSPLNGQRTPFLNGVSSDENRRFLCGSPSTLGSGGAGTHSHGNTDIAGGAQYDLSSATPLTSFIQSNHTHATSAGSNVPVYYDVKFIMRIK